MTPPTRAEPVREAFVTYRCAGASCLAVLAAPTVDATSPAVRLGVTIIVGGPQYRVGSHRQFTLLARAIATAGYPVLRFDYRGMGDSEGGLRTFESIHDDIAAAVDVLQRETRVERVVLWGLCDGASAALAYAASDERIAGVIAVNPWARTEGTLESVRLKHYYLRRLVSPAFWKKLLRGTIDVRGAADGLAQSLRAAAAASHGAPTVDYLSRMQAGWAKLNKPVLFVLSGRDLTAREFEAWVEGSRVRRALFVGPLTTTCAVSEADHTFSSRAAQDTMTSNTLKWIRGLCQAS